MGRRPSQAGLLLRKKTAPRQRCRFVGEVTRAELEGVVPIRAHGGSIGIHFGAEVAKYDERFCFAEVFEGDTCLCAGFGAEVFVLRQLVESDQLRAIQRMTVDFSDPLDADQAVSAIVLDRAFDAWIDGELFRSEELLAFDAAVNDPLVQETLAPRVSHWNGFQVMVVLERCIEVSVPIELVDDEIDVLMLLLGHVLDQEFPWYGTTFHEVLVHPEDITSPLGLVGAEGSWGVEDAGRDEPPSAWFQAIGSRKIEDPVVTFVPVFDASPDLLSGGSGFQAHERVGEVVADVVVLWREVVRLGFPFLSHELGLFGALVHVVRNGAHVVEELRVHGPLAVLAPD